MPNSVLSWECMFFFFFFNYCIDSSPQFYYYYIPFQIDSHFTFPQSLLSFDPLCPKYHRSRCHFEQYSSNCHPSRSSFLSSEGRKEHGGVVDKG